MKYIIRILMILIISFPVIIYAAGLPQLIVCDPASGGKGNECDFSKLLVLTNNIIRYIIILATSIFSIVFMYAGFLYLTAVGDTAQISKAHGLFKSAIIGFVIILAAWVFVDFILVKLLAKPQDYRLLSN